MSMRRLCRFFVLSCVSAVQGCAAQPACPAEDTLAACHQPPCLPGLSCLYRSAATGAAGQMLHSALRRWLDSGDALLGPWQQGRDPLERALHSFEGVAGGPHVAPWLAGSRTGIGYAMAEDADEAGSRSSGGSSSGGLLVVPAPSPYPQPRALGAALLEAQLALVGRILAAVAPINQAAIMDALIAIASGGPQRRKDKEPAKRQAAAMAAAAAALAGMAALAAGGRGVLQAAGAELAPRMRQLADEVLEEASGSVALQRAAADLYAASAQLSSDAAAAALVRALCKEMAETASLLRRAALVLAVGSCGRAVGGLSLQAVLPTATDTLVAVARASDKSIRWAAAFGAGTLLRLAKLHLGLLSQLLRYSIMQHVLAWLYTKLLGCTPG